MKTHCLITVLLVVLLASVAPAAVGATTLPDGRVYELVSPMEKSGGVGSVLPLGSLVSSLEQFGLPLQSAPSGNGIAYEGEDFYEPLLGSPLDIYRSLRGTVGWTTRNLTPAVPAESDTTSETNLDVGFSPDLSTGIISSQTQLTGSAPKGYANLYIVSGTGITPLITAPPPNRSVATFGHAGGIGPRVRSLQTLLFAGMNSGAATTPAASHVLFAANDALTQATETAPAAVDGGELENNLYEWTGGRLRLVNVLPNGQTAPGASFGVDLGDEYQSKPTPSLSHVISADGSRIFWTQQSNLYVREDGERTSLIATDATFQTASADGGVILFTKEGSLYRYNLAGGTTADLASSGVQGVVGASADGLSVYFVSDSIVAPGEAQEGQPNLYLSHTVDPGGNVVRYITTLLPRDNELSGINGSGGTPEGDWYQTLAGRTAEASPNGRYLAFVSRKTLTGFDNTDAVRGVPDLEVFLYDSATSELACPSCNTDGSRPTSNTSLPAPVNGIYQQRYLDDAGHLFYSTRDSVVPQDSNGRSDVYEYEGGHDYLISPGNGEAEAVFADASESGNDVFFTTDQQLLTADGDQNVDLYDARVGGTLEESAPPSCSGEGCREPPESSVFQAPVSASYASPDNHPLPRTMPPAAKPLTRAQSYAKALRTCRAKRSRRARRACEARARRRYGYAQRKRMR